jgi:hypothetical protein
MDWAEVAFPAFFPKAGSLSGFQFPLSYRYYPEAGNFLAVSSDFNDQGIYVFGNMTGWEVRRVGPLDSYTCIVLPNACIVSVSTESLSFLDFDGSPQQKNLAIALPTARGSISVFVDPAAPTGGWVSGAVSGATLQVTADPSGLSPGVHNSALLVRFTRDGDTVSTARISVTFNVGLGLVAPSAQTLTITGNSTAADLAGSAPVALGNGEAVAWNAAASAPWLLLHTASGTTPSTMEYAIDPVAVAALSNFADHESDVTISAAGLPSVTFKVTLRKRLPYLQFAMPYGVPAQKASRIVISGEGFTQFANSSALASALASAGVVVSNPQVQSDTQIVLTAKPASAGTFALKLSNHLSIATTEAALNVAPATLYQASSVAHDADKTTFAHDPLRKAVFGLSRFADALYRYQYSSGGWSVKAVAIKAPLDVALAPDGSRLFVTTANELKELDPVTLALKATYPVASGIQQTARGSLPISVDGKLWLPGSFSFGTMTYFDLASNTVKSQPHSTDAQGADYVGSADGSIILVSPSYAISPRGRWYLYRSMDGSVTNPMGTAEFWYDARLSADGSRVLVQDTHEVYDASFQLVGQLPQPASGEFWSRMALTPDGLKIIAIAETDLHSTARLDVFSTTALAPGTTRFAKIGSISVALRSADCFPQFPYGCEPVGYLMATLDNKSVIWAGNKRLQVFNLP